MAIFDTTPVTPKSKEIARKRLMVQLSAYYSIVSDVDLSAQDIVNLVEQGADAADAVLHDYKRIVFGTLATE